MILGLAYYKFEILNHQTVLSHQALGHLYLFFFNTIKIFLQDIKFKKKNIFYLKDYELTI